jgi:sirohydrochlorin cobaltochelatase
VSGPSDALNALRADGITHVAVKSLHFAHGMEYSELRDVVREIQSGQGPFGQIAVSQPIMDVPADFERMLRSVLKDMPAGTNPDDAILLVAHGSRRPEAQDSYAKAAEVCGRLDRRVILSNLLTDSGFEEVIRDCRTANVTRIVMAPLMIVAGTSVRNDLAGSGPGSLASLLGREGIRCVPMVKGLGDNNEIVRIWMEDVERMMAGMSMCCQSRG